jgi:DSF synthase
MDMNLPIALLEAPASVPGRAQADRIEYAFSPQFEAWFDKSQHAFWSRWRPHPRPCFNPGLLRDIRSYYDHIAATGGTVTEGADSYPVDYIVLASGMPGVFNLGGDLDLFKCLIQSQDRDGMTTYGRACVDVLHRNYSAHRLHATTISLVQGEALGGGFEAALSSDVIIAERSARFGFPEILFNLFPGMGAYSFLDRKIGQQATERLLTSGAIHSAEDMREMGVVDLVVDDGTGEAAVADFIKQRARSRNGHAAIARARRRVHGIDFEELLDIVKIWVDTALRINPRDLKLMQRLVSRQNGIGESAQVH